MKSRLNYSLHLCLLVSALALASCGKKENKVSSTPGTSLFSSSNPQLTGSTAGQQIINQVSSIKSNVACLNGGYRLSNDVNFFINGGYVSGTKIGGNWQSGFINTGTISKMWVGVSAYRDIMFVTQVANGSQVIGFNVTLSFCELKSNMANYPSIISNSRELVNFAAPYGIVLDSNTYCGYNVVDAALNTTIVSRRDPNNPNYTFDTTNPPVITSFTKPTCNGQF